MVSAVAALVLWQGGHFIWPGPRVFVLKGQQGSHSYAVRFEQANFKARGRTIVWKRNADPHYPSYTAANKVAGEVIPFYGRDPVEDTSVSALHELMQNTTELLQLSVTVDGKKWRVPRSAYSDLLDPNLDKEHVKASLSRDGKILILRMSNSDGAGSYNVRWAFTPQGMRSRKVEIDYD